MLPSATIKTGFTTLELVLVIAIMGILSAIAMPKVFGVLDNVREKAVGERLIEDLSYIRSYAISRHDTTWLVVNQANNQYALYTGPDPGTRVLLPDPQTGASAVLDLDDDYPGVTISSVSFSGGTVSFDWRGTPSEGGTIVLNGIRTITLIAETGMAYE